MPPKPQKSKGSKASEASQTKSQIEYMRLLLKSFHIHDPIADVVTYPTSTTKWMAHMQSIWVWTGRTRRVQAHTFLTPNRFGEIQTSVSHPIDQGCIKHPNGRTLSASRAIYELVNGPIAPEQRLVKIRRSRYIQNVNPFLYRIANRALVFDDALAEANFDAPSDPNDIADEILQRYKDPDFTSWVESILATEPAGIVAEAFRIAGVPRPHQ